MEVGRFGGLLAGLAACSGQPRWSVVEFHRQQLAHWRGILEHVPWPRPVQYEQSY
jgi:hypothetical protein